MFAQLQILMFIVIGSESLLLRESVMLRKNAEKLHVRAYIFVLDNYDMS